MKIKRSESCMRRCHPGCHKNMVYCCHTWVKVKTWKWKKVTLHKTENSDTLQYNPAACKYLVDTSYMMMMMMKMMMMLMMIMMLLMIIMMLMMMMTKFHPSKQWPESGRSAAEGSLASPPFLARYDDMLMIIMMIIIFISSWSMIIW